MADFKNTIDVLGDDAVFDSIIQKTITEYKDNTITKVGQYAFFQCASLKTVDLPNCESIYSNAFQNSGIEVANFPKVTGVSNASSAFSGCKNLKSVSFPLATEIPSAIFDACSALETVSYPCANYVRSNALRNCTKLAKLDFPALKQINSEAFSGCSALNTLVIRSKTVCSLDSVYAFRSTPIYNANGYIYVPSALVDSYKAASIWSTFANQFRKLEEWTVDGTVTGELATNRHMVRFFNSDGTLLGYKIVTTGSNATWDGAYPEDPSGDGAVFVAFNPSPTNVTADMDCYAKYNVVDFSSTDFSLGYGVEWNYSNSSPALTRIGLASGLSNPVPATSLTASGSSPFDNVLPWSGMKRYNVIDGAIAYSEDDAGFSMTDYDTVVYIPPFYYAAYKDEANTKWRWSISPVEREGYELHPGSGRYIGRYHTSGDSSAVFSKSGVQPLVNTSLTKYRTYSHNKGNNWWTIDIATWSALQLLFLVEFANFNSRSKLGRGCGNSSKALGSTDMAVHHTYNGGDTTNQYRWIEHPWGRVMDFVDGFMASEGACYLGTNNSTFTSDTTNLKAAGITLPSSNSYITGLGYSNKFPWAMLPDAASGGSSSTYIPDYLYTKSGTVALCVGGGYSIGDKNGMFFTYAFTSPSSFDANIGSRLIYIP